MKKNALNIEFQGRAWRPKNLVKPTESILLLSMVSDLYFHILSVDVTVSPKAPTLERLRQRMTFIYERARKTRLLDHAEFLIRVGELVRFSRYILEQIHLGATGAIPKESPL